MGDIKHVPLRISIETNGTIIHASVADALQFEEIKFMPIGYIPCVYFEA